MKPMTTTVTTSLSAIARTDRHARSIALTGRVEAGTGGSRVDAMPAPDPADALPTTVVEMWTDGACKGNPGLGGWGAWMRTGVHERELWGGDLVTTNNRMELTAVIEGLRALTRPCAVTLHVDSTYVMNGMSTWVAGWKRNGWLTGEKKTVKNKELWQALDVEIGRHTIAWVWVKGHSGDPGNERADQLANRGVDEVREFAG